jgi:hypothetical protein
LLAYAYCGGVRSSRRIERLCTTDVAFRVLCAQDVPDRCTIARFRSDCQDVFEGLFMQVLRIAARSGLARFGTVAIDGTKIAANASIDANRGHDWLEQQVRDMVADAKAVDAVEDTSSRRRGESRHERFAMTTTRTENPYPNVPVPADATSRHLAARRPYSP